MTKVFIIHGFEGHPNGGWRPWLTQELEKQNIYSASLVMKSPDKPKAVEWIKEIDYNVKKFPKDNIILIGYSLGVPTILKYLQSKNPKNIKGCILVSGPYKDDRKGKVAEVLNSFFVGKYDWKNILKFGKKFYVIHGTDDKMVDISHAEFLKDQLNGELITVKNGGHLNGSSGFYTLPEALESINKITKN